MPPARKDGFVEAPVHDHPVRGACRGRFGVGGSTVRARLARFPGVLLGVVLFGLGATVSESARADAETCPSSFSDPVLVKEINGLGDIVLADGRTLRLAAVTVASREARDVAIFNAMLKREVAGRAIVFASVTDEPARYGRLAGLVRLAEDEGSMKPSLQERALSEGVAVGVPETGYLGCMERLLLAERPARVGRRGLWRRLPLDARDADAVRAQIGRFTIVAGRITGVGNGRAVDYLNFGRVWRQDTTLRLTGEARAKLEQTDVTTGTLAGQMVTARGVVFEAGGPAIDIRWVEQLQH
ncbi:nuclease [Ancylobacter pratisalsi]|uniref:nuclease n=1 Tax=Ancylobacter pratisalsi TaxID=1745854 RepID=UPI001AED765E|nr:nuclease [Ancylobacter pratisalsi]